MGAQLGLPSYFSATRLAALSLTRPFEITIAGVLCNREHFSICQTEEYPAACFQVLSSGASELQPKLCLRACVCVCARAHLRSDIIHALAHSRTRLSWIYRRGKVLSALFFSSWRMTRAVLVDAQTQIEPVNVACVAAASRLQHHLSGNKYKTRPGHENKIVALSKCVFFP